MKIKKICLLFCAFPILQLAVWAILECCDPAGGEQMDLFYQQQRAEE